MIPSSDLGGPAARSKWKKRWPIIVSVVAVGVVLLWVALPTPWGAGLFETTSSASPWPVYVGHGAVATRCLWSPCNVSLAVPANSFLFMGFGYSVAQYVAGTMEIHGYTFTPANEYTKQNWGFPSLQAGFYYWVITATATVTVYLNYSTPATADVILEDFTNAAVTFLPNITAMGDGNGVSIAPAQLDTCTLGPTFVAGETVVSVTMAGTTQPGPPAPETSPIAATPLPAEVTGVPYSLVGESGVFTTQGPTDVTETLSTSSAYATVCLGIPPA